MVHDVPPASAAWAAVAEATGIGHGTSLLDVGCGPGGFCRVASARGALVHGADADPSRVAAARRSTRDATFRVARLERLPWPDGTFDVVTGFNVFQYAGDVDEALTEARRVTRDSGRVAVCKWGLPATNEFFAFLGSLDPSRFALRRPPAVDVVDGALARLGVRIVDSDEVRAPIAFDDDGALVTALVSAGARSESEDSSTWRARVAATAAPFRQADGSYQFDNRLMYRIFAA
jgi:cyclopropane fatty-acyl-phospholipid synthase-like methyltransferase